MTNEESIRMIRNYVDKHCVGIDMTDAFATAIKALEQEPCEDAISRQALRQKLQERHDFFVNAYEDMPFADKARVDEISSCIAEVVNAPSVTPQPKVGEWLKNGELCKCSNCHSNVLFSAIKLYNYCYHCGARMEVEE